MILYVPFSLVYNILRFSLKDWMWFRGDRVEILTGEDKGKQVSLVDGLPLF
jgi:hypothetical protein